MINEIEKYRALGDLTRFRIARILLKAGKELCVCEIEDILKIHQYNASKHLNLLKRSGLVEERKEGRLRMYKIKDNNKFNQYLIKSIISLESQSDNGLKNDFMNLKKRLTLRKDNKVVVTR
ncbi:MAG: metalloregulator ArsR/SmtB family transcription factor [Spirochaetes bacterium]|nr:metalloregulator ArsR/SmtB family transcription factor [Spirochaetota bacterium]